MKLRYAALGALPLCAGLLLAQDTSQTPNNASSQSWNGLLVASTCTAGAGMATSTPGANREHNTTYEQTTNQADRNAVASSAADPTGKMNTTTGTSTGTADRVNNTNTNKTGARSGASGATGADATGYTGSEANRSTRSDARPDARPDMPRSTDMKSTTAGNTANTTDAWAGAEQAAGQLDQSCRISSQTTSFALRTQDGTVVPFDAAANTRIAQQLQTGDRLQKKTKIFRVEVKGTMQDGAIVLDTIRM